MSLAKPVVNLHGRADAREEGRVQVVENKVGVGEEWNAEGKQKTISEP